ncbi:MAG TPA: TetR/AcrR family transcriptional regulator [Solirubrobacterales bacterium]
MPSSRVQLSHEMLLAAIGDRWSPGEVNAAAELLAGGDGQFPSGIRSLPPDLVSAIQRERLLAAALRATAELGYREMNVQDVLDRSGVSRPTFYEHFENKDACFLAALDAAGGRLRTRIVATTSSADGNWRDRLRAALEELLRFAADEPDAAATLVVEARAACPAALLRRDELLDHFASCLDAQIRADPPKGSPPSAIASAGVVGGIDALLYSRLNREEVENLEELLPSLMYFAVLPFEGQQVASEELALPVG